MARQSPQSTNCIRAEKHGSNDHGFQYEAFRTKTTGYSKVGREDKAGTELLGDKRLILSSSREDPGAGSGAKRANVEQTVGSSGLYHSRESSHRGWLVGERLRLSTARIKTNANR